MTSPVSRVPLTTAQIAVLQARPQGKAAPTSAAAQKVLPVTPVAVTRAIRGAAPSQQAPAPAAATPPASARPPQRGSLIDIVA
jgi:hypothetical protein